jgi:hypothetical protein
MDLESLEHRVVLSAWPDVFAHFQGEITASNPVDTYTIRVRAQDFQAPRRAIMLGFDLRATEGSLFDPGTINLLLNRPGDARIFHRDPEALDAQASVLLADIKGGVYEVEVRADAGLIGPYELGWYLAGDVNGDGAVTARDLNRIRAEIGQATGDPGVPLAADVDRDGRITRDDLRYAQANLGVRTKIRPIALQVDVDAKQADPEKNGLITRGDVELTGRTTRNSTIQLDVGNDGSFEVTAKAGRDGRFRVTAFIPLGRTTIRVVATDEIGQTTVSLLNLVRTDEVLNWNEVALVALQREGAQSPIAARTLAIVQAAINDTLASLDSSLKPYHVVTSGPATASREAAVASAAKTVLSALLPGQRHYFETAFGGSLAPVARGQARREGLALGELVATKILKLRANDGSANRSTDAGSLEPGKWRPTSPGNAAGQLARWGSVAPFLMRSSSALRAPAPPDISSADYAGFLQEVKQLGRLVSTQRTADQTQAARFWAGAGADLGTVGVWNRLARDAAIDQGFTVGENARLFAMLDLAMADASIVAYDSKYVYDLWRPVTAIRAADTDNNVLTESDPNWLPLLNTPATPSYVSEQSAYAGAAEIILSEVLGADFAPRVTTASLPRVSRNFATLAQAAEESGRSQVYAGVAFEFDNQRGLTMGRDVARLVLNVLA